MPRRFGTGFWSSLGGAKSIDLETVIADLRAQLLAVDEEKIASLKRRTETVDQLKQIVAAIGVIAGTMKRLSINAAIESARAGTAGLGFAVVATEMKSLANAAQGAAAQATDLLEARDRDLNRAVRRP